MGLAPKAKNLPIRAARGGGDGDGDKLENGDFVTKDWALGAFAGLLTMEPRASAFPSGTPGLAPTRRLPRQSATPKASTRWWLPLRGMTATKAEISAGPPGFLRSSMSPASRNRPVLGRLQLRPGRNPGRTSREHRRGRPYPPERLHTPFGYVRRCGLRLRDSRPDTREPKKIPDDELGYGGIRPYSALTKNMPAGPAQGALLQPSTSADDATKDDNEAAEPKPSGQPRSSTGLLIAIGGGVAAVAVVGIVLAVALSSRNRPCTAPSPGHWAPGQNASIPSQTQHHPALLHGRLTNPTQHHRVMFPTTRASTLNSPRTRGNNDTTHVKITPCSRRDRSPQPWPQLAPVDHVSRLPVHSCIN